MSAVGTLVRSAVACALLAAPAAADSTSGIDGVLFRSSYDANGVFSLEGARLMPVRDLSFKVLVGYARAPLSLAVPGIGGATDTSADHILDYVATLDMAFGMTLTERFAIGLDIAAYRTATSPGYGARGRYASGGTIAARSTGLIALRLLSNIDPSADPDDPSAFLGDGLAGPLDARVGAKVALITRPTFALTAIGTLSLPFGEDTMLLGDRSLVFEPRLALEWRPDRITATRLVANLGAKLRKRTILEGYDAADPAATADDARVFFDLGSELLAGVGGVLELTPRTQLAAEAQLFAPLPSALSYGGCERYSGARCSTIDDADYFGDAGAGDLAVLGTAGVLVRVSADVTASAMLGAGALGVRSDDVRATIGVTWAPQPAGVAAPGRGDQDGDGVPSAVDACPDDPEDKDGFQDDDGCPDPDNDGDGLLDGDDRCPNEPEDKDGFEDGDGCPEGDNDGDGVPDASDRCPNEREDKDGFEDEDGCADDDNDGDGFPDASDRCPNDAETVNGVDDDDGCPDVRGASGPEERADRIDLKGAPIGFVRGAQLTAAARRQLDQVAAIIKARKLTVRVEVHVALGTRAARPAAIAAQKRRDRATSQARARAILDYLVAQGVPLTQVQAVGLGAERPLGSASPTDAINERVDLIKAQQGGAP